ncbi:MAG: DUF2484 family protein [Paracoccaceae bacterium]
MMMPVLFACLWVLAATGIAFLPMRRQIVPGLVLLACVPVLIVWLYLDGLVWIAAFALIGFLSMFRKPLQYLASRAMGKRIQPRGEGRPGP